MDMSKIAGLFAGNQDTLILSCLQGHMGYAIADDDENPTAAQVVVGDFCSFAGKPNEKLAARAAAQIIAPLGADWEPVIEKALAGRVEEALRYSIKKEPHVFNLEKLREYAAAPDESFTIKLIDEEIYNQAMGEPWSEDLCSLFDDWDDYNLRGLGVAAVHEGRLVAGASSYCVYGHGIEIEIDTKLQYRRRGLATACGARLILECLERGLYPSWDAHDLRSVALAEKLGYHLDKPYKVYYLK